MNVAKLSDAAWYAYTAGRRQTYRDELISQARDETNDPLRRRWLVQHARNWHGMYLDSLRKAFKYSVQS